jgi:hypothetical protein
MREDPPDRGGVVDESDESDVATTATSCAREACRDPRNAIGPRDSGGVAGTVRGIGDTLSAALSQTDREEGRQTRSLAP